MSWNDGYVSDLDYTKGYYSDFSTNRMKFALNYAGFKAPNTEHAYELGIGYGLNIIFNATGSTTKWYGNDFNPRHIAWAKDLNVNSDNIEIDDFSFEEMSTQKLEKKLDYICLHGIWTWISKENQDCIKQFIYNNLSVGGVLYISYNVFPGWSDFLPIRYLMQRRLNESGSGVTEDAVNDVLIFAEKIITSSEKIKQNSPNLKKRIDGFKKQKHSYVAHELLNKDWNLTDFGNISNSLREIKLDYAGSANLKDYIRQINFSEEQTDFLNSIHSLELRETAGDIVKNQAFRSEFWIRGALKLTRQERKHALDKYKFLMVRLYDGSELKLSGLRTSATLQSEIYAPILQVLSDLKLKSVPEIKSEIQLNVSDDVLYEAMLILTAHGSILPVNDLIAIEQVSDKVKLLNARIIEKTFAGDEINFLLSPVTGTGLAINKVEKIFIYAHHRKDEEIISLVKETLIKLRENLVKDGKTFDVTKSAGDKLIRSMLRDFKSKHKLYQALGLFL